MQMIMKNIKSSNINENLASNSEPLEWHSRKMRLFFILLCTFTFQCLRCTTVSGQIFQPVPKTEVVSKLGCHRRLYTYRVTQSDSQGRQCWDDVNVWSCWGRCDSSEISDWKFPYKRSFHPVCVHAERQPNTVTLRNCDADVGPEATEYKYLEAVSCHCRTCSSMDTSCEAPSNGPLEAPSSILSLTGTETVDYE